MLDLPGAANDDPEVDEEMTRLTDPTDQKPLRRLTGQQTALAALLFAALAIVLHAPHFIVYESETTIDFFAHYNWLKDFAESVRLGDPYPRWIHHARFELGQPTLLFYSPLYYWTATLFSLSGATIWQSMHLAEILSSILFAWFGFLALACRVRYRIALLAGVLLLFCPMYVMVQYKFHGFPWAFGFAAHAFFVWALLRPGADEGMVNIWAAVAIALSVLSHTVSALIMLISLSPLGVARLSSRDRWIDARSVFRWLTTVALGLALSAVYLVPALASMKFIHADAMTEAYVPWHAFSFPIFTRGNGYFWFAFQWPLSLVQASTVLIPTWYAWTRMSPHNADQRVAIAVTAVGLLSLFFSSELSYVLWTLDTPLRKVQFPFRFMAAVAIAGIVLMGLTLDDALERKLKVWRTALGLLVVVTAVTAGFVFVKSSHLDAQPLPEAIRGNDYTYLDLRDSVRKDGWTPRCPELDAQCADARRRGMTYSGLPEHVILGEGPEGRAFARSGLAGECARHEGQCVELPRSDSRRQWQVSFPRGVLLRLPLNDFPAWLTLVDDQPVKHATDPLTGVISVNVPEGTHRISVRWQRLATERAGAWLSFAATLALLVCAWRRGRHRDAA